MKNLLIIIIAVVAMSCGNELKKEDIKTKEDRINNFGKSNKDNLDYEYSYIANFPDGSTLYINMNETEILFNGKIYKI